MSVRKVEESDRGSPSDVVSPSHPAPFGIVEDYWRWRVLTVLVDDPSDMPSSDTDLGIHDQFFRLASLMKPERTMGTIEKGKFDGGDL